MKPRRLAIEGFGAMRDRVELDFRDADFFALVGPTGSGKSTVIDAICFALYGAIPRYEDSRLVTAAISAQALAATVDLEFERGADRYRIVRIARRSGQNKVQLDRLDHDGQLVATIAATAREVKPAIIEIVGLDFDQFTKCVVLPQGAFSALLHESEAKRNELLVRLLDLGVYSRIGKLAGQRANKLDAEIAVTTETLSRLRAVTDDELALAGARLAELRELFEACKDLLTIDGEHELRISEAHRDVQAAQQSVTALDDIVIPEELVAAFERAGTTKSELITALALLDTAEAASERAETTLASRPTRADLERVAALHIALANAHSDVAQRSELVSAAEAGLASADRALADARATHAAAVAAYDDIRRAEAAHALREHLHRGDECPVCRQTVDDVPSDPPPAQLAAASNALRQSEHALDQAVLEQRSADRSNAAAAADLATAQSRLAAALSDVADTPTAATIARQLDELAELESHVARSTIETQAARRRVAQARDAIETAERSLAQHQTTFSNQRDAVSRSGASDLPTPTGDLANDWDTLQSWAVSARTRYEAQIATANAEISTQARRRRDLVEPLRGRLSSLGVETPPDTTLADARDRVYEAGIEARKDLEEFERAREQARELRERLPVAEREHEVARDLNRHLGAKRFESWLLRRALDELAERASIRLGELSSNRYALAIGDKGDFMVIDHHHGSETRPARSLSGGETFQASLALALALAEQVAELSPIGATALESIFLDEGFGTLDPEALDIVAGTIEQLGSGERMVGIVTHVAALAERVPVRFRIGGDRRTATIEREPATAP